MSDGPTETAPHSTTSETIETRLVTYCHSKHNRRFFWFVSLAILVLAPGVSVDIIIHHHVKTIITNYPHSFLIITN